MIEDLLRAALAEAWPGEHADSGGGFQVAVLVAAAAADQRRRRRRRLSAAAALLGLLALGGGALTLTGRLSVRSRLSPLHQRGPGQTVLPGHGYAAIVTGAGGLDLVPLQGGRTLRVVAPPANPGPGRGATLSDPAFSPDGRWLSYLSTSNQTGRSQLLVAPVAGAARPQPIAAAVTADAWSPIRDLLAVLTTARLELVNPTGTVRASWPVAHGVGLAFAPDGRSVVVGAPHGLLEVLPLAGGTALRLTGLPATDCGDPAGWTADGSRVLSWDDQQCSASIGADGLPLESFPVHGGPVRGLGVTLPYPSWVVPVSGSTVILDRGTNRVVAAAKALVRCDAATGDCQQLPVAPGDSALDPALVAPWRRCASVSAGSCTDGLVWTEAPASGASVQPPPTTPAELWLGDTTGAGELATAAGSAVADPQPDPADHGDVLFLRVAPGGTSATLERLTVSTGRVVALAELAVQNYFGHIGVGAGGTFAFTGTSLPGGAGPVLPSLSVVSRR